MTLIKIGNRIINIEMLASAILDETAKVVELQLSTGEKLSLAADDTALSLYAWLVENCAVSFDAASEQSEKPSHGLSKSAWTMLVRIDRHEKRSGLLGLPIDDDDMDVTIELERKMLIRTDVHNAWLTENGRTLLAEHRAEKEEQSEDEER